MLFASLQLAATDLPIDGFRPSPMTICYELINDGKPWGVSRLSIGDLEDTAGLVWDIVVRTRYNNGSIDDTNHFLLEAKDLTPLETEFHSKDNISWTTTYHVDKATTVFASGKPTVETELSGRVWDGDLWGFIFTGLPLAEGAHFEIPTYDWYRGVKNLTVDVIGSLKYPKEEAWVLTAKISYRQERTYLIGKKTNVVYGFKSGGYVERAGGDCSMLPED